VDNVPFNGFNYYRLLQVDYDGTIHYFSGAAIRFTGKNDIRLYPNPTDGSNVSLFYSGESDLHTLLLIKDISGKEVVSNDNIILHPGFNKLTTDLQNIDKGTYFLFFIAGDASYRQKMVIIN